MHEEIERLIPELKEISDETLREKTARVWIEALEKGGWKTEELTSIPFTLLVDKVSISFLEHVRTVCKLCIAAERILVEAYGDRVRIDRDTLIAGALIADVGKLLEYAKENGKIVKSRSGKYLRHPFTGVAMGFEQGLPDEILHVAAVHSKEGDHFKRSPEAIIFHHADFTDFELVQ